MLNENVDMLIVKLPFKEIVQKVSFFDAVETIKKNNAIYNYVFWQASAHSYVIHAFESIRLFNVYGAYISNAVTIIHWDTQWFSKTN